MTITAVHNIGDTLRPIITPIPTPGPVPEDFVPLPGPVPQGNGGIVPPWLEGIDFGDDPGWGLEIYDPQNPIVPVDPDMPHIM